MTRKLTPEQVFNDLMAKHEPALAQAFIDAVADIKSVFSLQRFTAALSKGDIEGAIATLGLEPAAFDDLLEAVRSVYMDAGKATTQALPSQVAAFRFSGRNLRAEAWLRDHSASLVSQILEDQRRAVRQVLVSGMAQGTAPRSLAVQIVGRTSRVTGRREGGVLGLTGRQAEMVQRARDELASGDPSQLKSYLARTRRDRRFDRSLTKAIRDSEPLPRDVAAKALVAYERRLLQLRAQTVARTEAMTSLHQAQYEGLLQAVDAGTVTENQIRRVWRSASDLRVRHTHQGLNGESVGLREVFVSQSGAALRFPGDPSAPVGERVNCRCWAETRIDFNANIR